VNIKDAIFNITAACRDVPASCRRDLWQIFLPQRMEDFTGLELPLAIGKLQTQCVTLAKHTSCNVVEEKDVKEFFQLYNNDDISTNELKELHMSY
jgi:hypothetical protein